MHVATEEAKGGGWHYSGAALCHGKLREKRTNRERENVPVVGVTGSQLDERLSLELMICRLESWWKLAWDGLGARE